MLIQVGLTLEHFITSWAFETGRLSIGRAGAAWRQWRTAPRGFGSTSSVVGDTTGWHPVIFKRVKTTFSAFTLFEESNFYPTLQFFSGNQSCQQLKSPKPQHFHEFFTQKDRQFSRKIKIEFLEKKMNNSHSVFVKEVIKSLDVFLICQNRNRFHISIIVVMV